MEYDSARFHPVTYKLAYNSNHDLFVRLEKFCLDTSLQSFLRPVAEVKQVTKNTLLDVLEKYGNLFRPELGHCKELKAHVELEQGAVPVLRKPFPVAHTLRGAGEAELRGYVDMGVLTPVEQSDWTAPIAIAKKLNKKVRLCADFSTGTEGLERVRQKMMCSNNKELRTFTIGEKVLVRDYVARTKPWTQGVISKRKGDVVYLVEVSGKIWKRHANQIRWSNPKGSSDVWIQYERETGSGTFRVFNGT
ncbi:hypothetical protein M513_08494 [Trichuris suis]|uniref:Uncharacterized protein n=1 Tax=Trichuris suis TaxID=68888 RepID=A0A085M0E1_9BILA|nr:hypothetical protein M513_08494 [Trichuris suis]